MDNLQKIQQSLTKRKRAESRFRWYGRIAIFIGLAAVMVLFTDIISKGHGFILIMCHIDKCGFIFSIDLLKLSS